MEYGWVRNKSEGLAYPSPGLPRHVATPGYRPQTELNPVGIAYAGGRGDRAGLRIACDPGGVMRAGRAGTIKIDLGRRGQRRFPSIPQVAFVEFHLIFLEDPAQFILERFGAMMLFLSLDVFHQGIDMGGTDGERRVSLLPFEARLLWSALFDPHGGFTLDLFEQVRQSRLTTEETSNMDVILDSPHGDHRTLEPVAELPQHGMHFQPQALIRQHRTTQFCRKNEMNTQTCEGLGHGRDISIGTRDRSRGMIAQGH
jgi:hypothetical protein